MRRKQQPELKTEQKRNISLSKVNAGRRQVCFTRILRCGRCWAGRPALGGGRGRKRMRNCIMGGSGGRWGEEGEGAEKEEDGLYEYMAGKEEWVREGVAGRLERRTGREREKNMS